MCVVQTPQGHQYEGRRYDGKGVSGGWVFTGFPPLILQAASSSRLHRSPVCRSCVRARRWSPPWGPCAKMCASARSWSRPTWIQESQRWVAADPFSTSSILREKKEKKVYFLNELSFSCFCHHGNLSPPPAALPAALPASAQRHRRGSRHPHGQHRFHRSCSHDGSTSPAGGWRLTSMFSSQTS